MMQFSVYSHSICRWQSRLRQTSIIRRIVITIASLFIDFNYLTSTQKFNGQKNFSVKNKKPYLQFLQYYLIPWKQIQFYVVYNLLDIKHINMSEQEQMGQLALVLGDFHIPMRAFEVPAKYKEMITPNKVNAVFCTGNLGSREAYDWCKSLSPIFHVVKGDYEDETLAEFPEDKVFEYCGTKIGMIHGHQIIPWSDEEALENKAKELGVKLLISGHSHELKTSHHNETYFLNPGSMTGAYSSMKINAVPSFMILEFKSTEIVIYEYSLIDGELKCEDGRIPRV